MAGITSNYPASIDSESNIIPPNNGDTLTVPGHWLAGNNGPIINVQNELGTDPSGYAADVKTRLNDINPSEGNLNLDAGYGSKAPIYGVRAWVNFDGTTNTGGNCDIRASANVSSVTDNGTGDYTINFTSAMPDVNYCTVYGDEGGFDVQRYISIGTKSTASHNIKTGHQNSSGTLTQANIGTVQVAWVR